MAYLTEDQLLRASAAQNRAAASQTRKSANARTLTIFLSHSHKDTVIVTGLINILRPDDVEIYVDWNDKELPRVTSRATAEQIKKEIINRQLFIILATQNAMESKWVPWEVGVADQSKSQEQILIVPVSDRTGQFHGSEYLQLYRRVEETTVGGYGVFSPNMATGARLGEYLRTRAR